MRVKLIALLFCLCLLASCSVTEKPQAVPDSTWPETARLDANETPEALYQAALQEDTLLVYTNTTRILEVKKSFEVRYPGLVVEVVDLRGGDILDTVAENHGAGQYTCDLIICTDESGLMKNELIPGGVLHKYVPWDMKDSILPEYNQETLVFLREAQVLFYNAEAYDAPPVSSWWELTEPQFANRVYVENPLKSDTVAAFFCIFLQNADLMADAYEDFYGEPLAIPEGSDGGREFIKRLLKNGVVFANANAEISQAVGLSGQKNPPVGIMISSRLRNNDMGYKLAVAWDIAPFAGIHAPNCVMMVEGAKSVNGAKLFVRWLLGEADGTGEGRNPYTTPGTWSIRTDEGNRGTPGFDRLRLPSDNDYFYQNREAFDAFWLSALEELNGQAP